MRLVTVKVPELYLEIIDIMVKKGLYSSRSEFIREAIKEKLQRLGVLTPPDSDTPTIQLRLDDDKHNIVIDTDNVKIVKLRG